MSGNLQQSFSLSTPIVNADGTASAAFVQFMLSLLGTDSNAALAFSLAEMADNTGEVLQVAQAANDAAALAQFADIP